MKLLRIGSKGQEIPAIRREDGAFVSVAESIPGFEPDFFASHEPPELERVLEDASKRGEVLDPSLRIGPPIARPGKIVCIGLNYRDHAAETGAPAPSEPIVFLKATSAINGPFDPVRLPRESVRSDWEVELAVIIGKRCSYVSESNALEYVLGYTILVDYSERDFQKHRKGQWTKGKSCDTFAPFGPWVVTRDDIPNPGNLKLWLSVNGQMKQESNTSHMIFPVEYLVSYVSQFMTLEPGDILSTGTPAGVGMGRSPEEYLHPGDTVRCGIEGIGEIFHSIVGS